MNPNKFIYKDTFFGNINKKGGLRACHRRTCNRSIFELGVCEGALRGVVVMTHHTPTLLTPHPLFVSSLNQTRNSSCLPFKEYFNLFYELLLNWVFFLEKNAHLFILTIIGGSRLFLLPISIGKWCLYKAIFSSIVMR